MSFVTTVKKTNTDGALKSDTQSALAEKIFDKTSNHLLQKEKIHDMLVRAKL